MDSASPRRWWALVVIALTQLVVVLDGTIVSIALPRAQADLGLSDSARQWAVTAYALAFGCLLLLGGRIADAWGRKRSLMIGMVGFALASAYGGLVGTGQELILARGLQGVFAALMAPAALAILTTTFPSGRERTTAFAVFGTVGGAGAAIGLVLGGLLTEFLSWRWCLLVNVPVIIVTLIGAGFTLEESKAAQRRRLDVAGLALGVVGVGGLVYGMTLLENDPSGPLSWAVVVIAAIALIAFVQVERRHPDPLLPLRIVTDRVRGGSLLIQLTTGAVMISATLFLTFHLQLVLEMSPVIAGLASLPLTIVISLFAPLFAKALPAIGPRVLMICGPLVAAAGMLLLTRITADGDYWTQVFPALCVLGAGMAAIFVPMQNLALLGIDPADAGAGSAVSNSAMQIGGSLGLALFTGLYSAAVGAGSTPAAMVDGYRLVFAGAAAVLFLGAVVAAAMIRGPKQTLLTRGAEVVHLG